jgi:hypothetical protein
MTDVAGSDPSKILGLDGFGTAVIGAELRRGLALW